MKVVRVHGVSWIIVILAVFSSCVKESPVNRNTGVISPAVSSSSSHQTKSMQDRTGMPVDKYTVPFEGDDSLYISVFEYSNDYNPGVFDAMTKGSAVTTASLNVDGGTFKMNGWLGAENRYDGTLDDGRVYDPADMSDYRFVNDAVVTRTNGVWGMDKVYYWRNGVPSSFWSLYPASAPGCAFTWPATDANDEDQKKVAFSYDIPAVSTDAASLPDICLAFSSKKWEEGGDDVVDVLFRHALSAVYFEIKDIADGVTIKDISISGIKGSGTCIATGSAASGSSAGDICFAWAPTGQARSWKQTFSSSDFSGNKLVSGSSKIFMLVPQQLTDDAEVTCTFVKNGSDIVKTVCIGKEKSGIRLAWEAGKEYNYQISFSGNDTGLDLTLNGAPLDGGEVAFEYSGGSQVLDIDSFLKDGSEQLTLVSNPNIEVQAVSPAATWNALKGAPVSGTPDSRADLSAGGETANCYLVHGPGYYRLPLVYGNARKSDGSANSASYNPGSPYAQFTDHAGAGRSLTFNTGGADPVNIVFNIAHNKSTNTGTLSIDNVKLVVNN